MVPVAPLGRPAAPPAGAPHRPEPSPLRRAAGDAVPVVLAYLPFGLALGAVLATTAVPTLVGWAAVAAAVLPLGLGLLVGAAAGLAEARGGGRRG